jgi:hypothetical protein
MSEAFRKLARRVAREFFPSHFDVLTSFDDPFIREDSADIVEIRVCDRSTDEPRFGVAAIHGQLLRSPHLEDAVGYELRGLAERMGTAC